MKVTAREKASVVNLLNFVKEIYDIKRPFSGNINTAYIDWQALNSNLPGVTQWTPTSVDPSLLCQIERLSPPTPPKPDDRLQGWYIPSFEKDLIWKDELERTEFDADGNEIQIIERFTDDSKRVQLKEKYLQQRTLWLQECEDIQKNNTLFDTFMNYWDEVKSSNLKKELVLGNFVFDSSDYAKRSNIKYPILTSPVKVEILPGQKLQLQVRLDPEEKTTIHNEIFVAFDDEQLNGQAFDDINQLLVPLNKNLLDAERIQDVLTNEAVRLSTKCRWRESQKDKKHEDGVYFQNYPLPVFFIPPKPKGLKEAVNTIIETIESTSEVPAHLVEIAYPDGIPSVALEDDTELSFEAKLAATAGEDTNILLTKKANAEQLNIALDIERNDVLLVQGPPGTGKTHTIANLMGHFLAQGKRILVTSEKVKALSVLKDKLPKEIQPLCVSRLGDTKDLLTTAENLRTKLDTISTNTLRQNVVHYEFERKELIAKLATVRKQIYLLRQKDVASIVVDGKGYSFIDLAKTINAQEKALSNIIPGQIAKDAPCPDLHAIEELYSTNGYWPEELEKELTLSLLSANEFPPAEEVAEMFEAYNKVANSNAYKSKVSESTSRDTAGRQSIVFRMTNDVSLSIPTDSKNVFTSLISNIDTSLLSKDDPVIQRLLVIGADELALIDQTNKVITLLGQFKEINHQLHYADQVFSIQNTADTGAVKTAAQWFIDNRPDGQLTSFERFAPGFMKPKAVQQYDILKTALLGDAFPQSREGFESVLLACRQLDTFQQIARLWNRFIVNNSVHSIETLSDALDLTDKWEDLHSALDWWLKICKPLLTRLEQIQAHSKYLGNDKYLNPQQRIAKAKEFIIEVLLPINSYLSTKSHISQFEDWRNKYLSILDNYSKDSKILNTLRHAFQMYGKDYKEALQQLAHVNAEQFRFERRAQLLHKLKLVAPDWAQAIIDKREGFNTPTVPVNIKEAWLWKQLEIAYNELAELTIDDLQKKATLYAELLRKATAQLAANKAWLAVQIRLSSGGELSALSRLATLMARATGSGKNVERNRQAAVALLPECITAVPAWIMTLDQAIGSFGNAAKFDIIIVDEASQADITALPILYMSKKIIVVGDDKQVTPEAVGTKIDVVNQLSDQYLHNYVKSPALFDTKMSLYGLIKANAFRSRMLVEHFRCLPDIIGFSNQLCYEKRIRPLRDSTDTNIFPTIVPWRVDVKNFDDEFNQDEALEAVNLINAMIAQPEYKGKTFGLITMRSSNNEVERLRELVNEKIDPREKEAREIICGTSAEFQGDERDVILMLLCDVKEPGSTLRLMKPEANGDMPMKRYNVAVSRAKDQLWVLHSFDPATQLRHEDIRSHLFAWIKSCSAPEGNIEQIRELADSEFEVQVAQALIAKGYKIEQQHQVGNFRIDIVVYGENASVAVECDGDQYHSKDDDIRHDMERQAILERNGWQFIRIRGGKYFRHPDIEMEKVCQQLEQKGIRPNIEAPNLADSPLLDRIKSTRQKIVQGQVLTQDTTIDIDKTIGETTSVSPVSVKKNKTLPQDKPRFEKAVTEQVNSATPAKPIAAKPSVSTQKAEKLLNDVLNIFREPVEIASPQSKKVQVFEPKADTSKAILTTPSDTVRPMTKPQAKAVKVEKKAPQTSAVKKEESHPKASIKSKTEVKTKPVQASVAGLTSSPVPKVAHSLKPGLTEIDKKRIIAEDAIIWEELQNLGCVLIDKRDKKGALWIVPPEGKDIKTTILALAKRFHLSFIFTEKGGNATKHWPSWYLRSSWR